MSSLSETQASNSAATLAALVRDFDRDAAGNGKRLNEVLQSQPETFYLIAIEILKKGADTRAAQYVVKLLVSQNLLFRALCDPALGRERAAAVAQLAVRIDPMIDIGLARQMADASTSGSSALRPGMAARLMELLDEISNGTRILPSLMRMLRNDDPYLRSKAVLMIGRCGRSLNWIQKRLEESDARVRANAIEAMWGMDTADARELFEWATKDGNNRVAGNAFVGLYRLGDCSLIPELLKMAGHDSVAFRRTAAWVMGETGDPRFTEVVGRMIADGNGDVRKNAFTAMGRIRAAVAQVAQAGEWPVAGFSSPKDPRTGQRRLSIAVVTADGRESPQILPVQFMLSENGQPIWSYRVLEKMFPEPMTVMFLVPRKTDNAANPWEQGAVRCLTWKRSTDLWSMVPYSGVDDNPSQGPADLELPSFIANASQAARAFQETPKRADCTGFWTGIKRAVLPGDSPVRGKRHLIVLVPDEVGGKWDDNLLGAVHASRTAVQVVSASANPALQEFCRRVDGRFHFVEDKSAIEERISLAYLSLLARYEIRYHPLFPDAASLKLRVHTPAGWGETIIPLPG